eukprot:6209553-Pleurochrysis_carterae.AAC.4
MEGLHGSGFFIFQLLRSKLIVCRLALREINTRITKHRHTYLYPCSVPECQWRAAWRPALMRGTAMRQHGHSRAHLNSRD